MNAELDDKQQIRDQVQNWVVWRDSGQWEKFATVWHDGARMHSSWYRGPVADFIAHARKSFTRGAIGAHFLGGGSIELNGDRAIAQTKKRIDSRQTVEGIVCDVVCLGRFYQFFEKRDGRWAVVLHQGIYEKDRIDPVDPRAVPALDRDLLAQFPEGYRHLAYVQTKAGFAVFRDLPGLHGASVERLYAAGAQFLAGAPPAFE
jgi:hypothetical protein